MSHDPHADPDMLRREWAGDPTVIASTKHGVLGETVAPDGQPACDVHYWQAVDRRDDVYRCRHCGLTWSLDDDPDGEAA